MTVSKRLSAGRPRILDSAKEDKARELYYSSSLNIQEICTTIGISRATFFRYKKRWGNKQLRVAIEDVQDLPIEKYYRSRKNIFSYQFFDLEMARFLSKSLELKLKLVPVPFSKLVDAVQLDRADIALGKLSNSSSRKRFLDFTDPYVEKSWRKISFVGLKKRDFKDLFSKKIKRQPYRIGVQNSSLSHDHIVKNFPYATPVCFESMNLAFDHLKSGLIDGVLCPQFQNMKFLKANPEFESKSPTHFFEFDTCIGVQKGKDGLGEKINWLLGSDQYAQFYTEKGLSSII